MNNKTDIPEIKLLSSIMKRCKDDSAFRAAIKKADNPDTEYRSWEYLADYGVNLEYEESRYLYTTIFAAAARSGKSTDGCLEFGKALVAAYADSGSNDYIHARESEPARARLRRVLACDSVKELCTVLRPVLRLITSKGVSVSFGLLLRDLKYYNIHPEQTKASWAQQFFGTVSKTHEEETA
jgi:CRISPR system CASCADE complex protein CasB/Cse2